MSKFNSTISLKKVGPFMVLLSLLVLNSCKTDAKQDNEGISFSNYKQFNKDASSRMKRELTCEENSILYFLQYDNDEHKNKATIATYNAETLALIDNQIVEIPDSIIRQIFANRQQLAVNQKSLYLLGFKGLIELELQNKKYVFKKTHPYPNVGFDRLSKLNDSTLILATFYNFHYKEGLPRFIISTFNTVTGKYVVLKREDKPLGIELSHFVNEFMAFSQNLVAVANPVLNEISIYEITGADKISLKNKIVLNADNSAIKKIFLEDTSALNMYQVPIKRMMYNVDSLSRKYAVHRIQKIFFLDNETLLISYLHFDDPDVRYLETVNLKNNSNTFSEITKHSIVDSLIYSDQLKIQYSTPIFWNNGSAITHTKMKPQPLKKESNQDSYYWLKYNVNLP
ncbi:MAG: hypothetical protein ACI8ZN_000225 [Bacteroidia bacterium]|jgi:hypothetical protein